MSINNIITIIIIIIIIVVVVVIILIINIVIIIIMDLYCSIILEKIMILNLKKYSNKTLKILKYNFNKNISKNHNHIHISSQFIYISKHIRY